MSRRAWWLSAAALLLLLPVAALGITVAVVDPNDYKPQVVAAVQRATGRTLTMGGPLRISRSLWPTIAVTDVKLANLPEETKVWCGHEYTQANAKFALTVDPKNTLLADRAKQVEPVLGHECLRQATLSVREYLDAQRQEARTADLELRRGDHDARRGCILDRPISALYDL